MEPLVEMATVVGMLFLSFAGLAVAFAILDLFVLPLYREFRRR